jgi:hypothetical protein
VFAVSGKDRGAVILGGRKADLVLWFDRFKGEFTTSSYYKRPSWLSAFNAELKKKDLLPVKGARVPKELIASPAYDVALDLLVVELIKRERVGRGASTDLLMVSYSGTDLVGHTHGLEAAEMDAQLASLDAITGRLLARLEKASGGSLALAFSSDHGAIPSSEDAAGKALGVRRLHWEKFGTSLEKTMREKWPLTDGSWILSNQIPHLYLNRRAAEARGLEWDDFLKQAAKLLSGVDGFDGVYVAGSAGTPFDDQFRRSYDPGRSGDLFAIMGRNVLLGEAPPGTSHGTPWDYDARVPPGVLRRRPRPWTSRPRSAACSASTTRPATARRFEPRRWRSSVENEIRSDPPQRRHARPQVGARRGAPRGRGDLRRWGHSPCRDPSPPA